MKLTSFLSFFLAASAAALDRLFCSLGQSPTPPRLTATAPPHSRPPMHRLLLAVLVLSLTSSPEAVAAPPGAPARPAGLRAGNVIVWEFPELANPLHAMVAGTRVPAKACVYLPSDYTPEKAFPLVLFISGAEGQTGDHAGFSRMIAGDSGYICVGVPSFKTTYTPPTTEPDSYWKSLIITTEDAPHIWAQYHPILAHLFATIPNIDRSKTFFGGFSNGAHTAAALLSHPSTASDFLAHFHAFLLIEGGTLLQPAVPLANTRFFLMRGDLHRHDILARTKLALHTAGAPWEEHVMAGVGHDIPEAQAHHARAWMERIRAE